MKLQLTKGWYLPDYDTHFKDQLRMVNNEWTYQQKHRDYVLEQVDDFGLAIDVGANVGFWSKDFCRKFKKVWAFEPVYDIADCFRRNMADFDNWHLEQVGLSDHQAENQELYRGNNCGGGSLDSEYESAGSSVEYVDLHLLDSYIDRFESVGLIKVDIQGHEYQFLIGAMRFLEKFNPVLSLELPTRNEKEKQYKEKVVTLLSGLGYKEIGHHKKDTVFKK